MPTKDLPTRFHHPVPSGESLRMTLDNAPEGQAVSVYRQLCWEVCVRYKAGTHKVREYFVVEHAPPFGSAKPKRITEPVATEKEAVDWVNLSAAILRMTHFQMPTWPWE